MRQQADACGELWRWERQRNGVMQPQWRVCNRAYRVNVRYGDESGDARRARREEERWHSEAYGNEWHDDA